MSKLGYVRFVDVKNKTTDAWFKGLPDATTTAQLASFATVVKAHVNPGIMSYGTLKPTYVIPGTIDMASNGNMESVKDKALLQFSYIQDDQQKSILLWLPCPYIDVNWTHVEGVGYRMDKAEGDEIAAALTTMTGIAGIEFVRGRLEYRESSTVSKALYSIVFRDVYGAQCVMGVPKPTSSAALGTFMDFLRTEHLSNASITKGLYMVEDAVIIAPGTGVNVPATDTGWDSVDRRTHAKFRYVQSAALKTKTFLLPGVQENACELVSADQRGYKLTKVVGDGLANALTGLYGSTLTFTFRSGKVDVVNIEG
jgi:hypothetical protein